MKRSLLLFSICIISMLTQAQVPTWMPSNGLVAWYPFTGNANDSSGNGNNGLVVGPLLTNDRFNNSNSAYHFDGFNDYIKIPPSTTLDIIGSVSVSAWVKFDASSNPAPQQQLFWRGDPVAAEDPYTLTISGGEYLFRCDGDFSSAVTTYPVATDQNFHHLVGVYDSVLHKYSIYLDAVKKDSTILSQVTTYATSQMWNMIGAVDTGDAQNFGGAIDDIAVYNRALSQCEIRQLNEQNKIQIVNQPQNVGISATSNAQFQVTTQGNNLSYQWQLDSGTGYANLTNSGPYSGVTTATLSIANVSLSMNNYHFRCIISAGNLCPVTTNDATLGVTTDVAGLSITPYVELVPNPANANIKIVTTTSLSSEHYLIADLSGKLVKQGVLSGTINYISIAEFSKGTYLFRLPAKGIATKFVIQ